MDLSNFGTLQRAHAKKIIAKCAVSRVYFVEQILKATLEPWQRELLEDLDKGFKKIAIRSGHGVGKTAACAWLAVHFLTFRDDVKVIVTAPSADQMKDGLIPEVAKWIARMPDWMRSNLDMTTERVVRHPNTANNFISFRTARKEKPEALAGVHATSVMIIVDEASGVDEAIYETGQGALSTEGAIALLIGNPTRPSGFFYKTHTSLADVWRARRVSCLDSSRVSEDYIETVARTYGVDSREYRVRVLGEFPESGQDAVIPRSWVEASLTREVVRTSHETVWGLDPGRGGDPTGFVERKGNVLTDYKNLRYDDLMNTVGWIHNRYNSIRPSMRPDNIFVDSIGLGAGVADRLAELGLPVVHVNVAEAPSMRDRYANLRAELWFLMREWFESRDVYIYSTNLTEQLIEELSQVESQLMSNGKIKLESKEEMRRRGVLSPNLADALAITFADHGAVRIGNVAESWGKYDPSKVKTPNLV